MLRVLIWQVSPDMRFKNRAITNILKKEIAFSDIINGVATNAVRCYDLFDMLLYGKKTPLIDM